MILRDEETGKRYSLTEIKDSFKVAFVVGHSALSQGAYSETLEQTEFQFWESFANRYLVGLGTVFTHKERGYQKSQAIMADLTKEFHLVFELHFNSLDSSIVSGAEAFYYDGNNKTKLISDKFSTLMFKKMSIKPRVSKGLVKGDRGRGFVAKQRPSAIGLEPFFGSNEKDCITFDKEKYVEVIKELIEFSEKTLC